MKNYQGEKMVEEFKKTFKIVCFISSLILIIATVLTIISTH